MRPRVADRVEDAVAWLLASLALLVVVIAYGVGTAGHADVLERARTEASQRFAVRAVLLEPSGVMPAADGIPVIPQEVRARWTSAGGAAVTGTISVTVRGPAGAEVPLWVDRAGQVVKPPQTAAGAVITGWARGVGTALFGWCALLLVWWAVRRSVAARNAAGWDRDWARVEPAWSGRVG
jgi:hypothetical protein